MYKIWQEADEFGRNWAAGGKSGPQIGGALIQDMFGPVAQGEVSGESRSDAGRLAPGQRLQR
ncbi:MAG: hypothetical protein P4L98_24755, partial [Ancalomicrobiaceae bacterium]|nr:hypothetical protein [Ancalomicrobiaceae bacterium]